MTRIGLFLPQLRTDFATIEARVRAAEEAGFDSVWLMDHLLAPAAPDAPMLEAWTTATALAARTERIRIGHLVLCDAFRHPALLATMAASLDVISGGRLELGLGWGSVPDELDRFGFPPATPAGRAARLRETITVLRAMWRGEPFDHDGPTLRLRGAQGRPVPVQDPLPVHVGGGGAQRTLPIARDLAHWWNCPSYAVDRLAELAPLARPARISVQHPIGLAASTAELDEVRAVAERRFGGWGGLVVGTPDEVAAALRAERDLGVELVVCQFHDFGRPETTARFMAEVAPALR